MTEELPNRAGEDRQQHIKQKTSFAHYMLKVGKSYGTLIAGGAIGFFVGNAITKNDKVMDKITDAAQKLSKEDNISREFINTTFKTVTATAGAVLSQVVNAYDGWRRKEGEQLQVEETNQDIGALLSERKKFAETLNRQEQLIKDIIAQRKDAAGYIAPTATTEISR